MSHRSSQQGSRFLECADTGQGNNLCVTVPFPLHFIHKRRHTVNPCIARTDDAHRFSLLRQLESLLGADTFAFHSCIYTFRIGAQVRSDKAEIVFIAHHCIRFL